jgi:hypothetical protein
MRKLAPAESCLLAQNQKAGSSGIFYKYDYEVRSTFFQCGAWQGAVAASPFTGTEDRCSFCEGAELFLFLKGASERSAGQRPERLLSGAKGDAVYRWAGLVGAGVQRLRVPGGMGMGGWMRG